MKEFIMACLPFVIMGLSIAIIAANSKKNKNNYLVEGMIFGISLGIIISSSLNYNLGLALSLGMLIGEMIGSFIKKK